MISENVGNIKQVQTLINEFNFDKLCFWGSSGMQGKSLLNKTFKIILSLNQSECRKPLRSASSRIGFRLDTGIEESACKCSCRPLLLAIRKMSSKDLFSPCFLLVRPLRHTPCDWRFLQTTGFSEIKKETSSKRYTPFKIGLNLWYGPYAHFGYWTLVSDPESNK